MELTSNRVFALIEPNDNYLNAIPVTTAGNVLFVNDHRLSCEVDAIYNEASELDSGIKTLINTSLKGGQSTFLLSSIGPNTKSSRINTIQRFFDGLESTIESNVELEYVYLRFSDEQFHDFRKGKFRSNRDLYENGLYHFSLPAPNIKTIKESFELKSKYPFMLQIHFKNTMNGSITLIDLMNTSYLNRKAFGLSHSFQELRDALSHSVNPNYTGVMKTDRTPFTYILEDFIAGRTQSLSVLLLNRYSDSDQNSVDKAFDFMRNCRKLKSRVVFKAGKATENLYTKYKTLQEDYGQLKDHYNESRRRHESLIKEYDLECAIRELNMNTSKTKQALLSNETWKLQMDHERYKMKSDNLEHDLKMDIVDLKMKISELTAENEEEKNIKKMVWQDCCVLTTKCQQLEKMLGKLREKNAILKSANDDLMDSKNEQQNNTVIQYKSMVAENKFLKDKTGRLETSLETANKDLAKLKDRIARLEDANAKLEDRNAQLRMGAMPGMLPNEFHPLSRFGHTQHMNTNYMEDYNELQIKYDKLRADFSKNELQYKYDKLRADYDQKVREEKAKAEELEAMKETRLVNHIYKKQAIMSQFPRMAEPPKEALKKQEPPIEAPKTEEPPKEALRRETPPKEASRMEDHPKESPRRKEPPKETPKRETLLRKKTPRRKQPTPKKVSRREAPPPKEATKMEEAPKESLRKETLPPKEAPPRKEPLKQVSQWKILTKDTYIKEIPPRQDNGANTAVKIDDSQNHSISSENQLDKAFIVDNDDFDDMTPVDSQVLLNLSPSLSAYELNNDLPQNTSDKTSQKSHTIIEPIQKLTINEQKTDDDNMSIVLGDDNVSVVNQSDNKSISVILDGDPKNNAPVAKDDQSDNKSMSDILDDDLNKAENTSVAKDDQRDIPDSLDVDLKDNTAKSMPESDDLNKANTSVASDPFESQPVTPRRNKMKTKIYDFARRTPKSPLVKSPHMSLLSDDDDFQASPELPPVRTKVAPAVRSYVQSFYNDDDSTDDEPTAPKRSTRGRGRGRGKKVNEVREPVRPNKKRKLNAKRPQSSHLFVPNAMSPLTDLVKRSGRPQ